MAHQTVYGINTPTIHHYASNFPYTYGFTQSFQRQASFNNSMYRSHPAGAFGGTSTFPYHGFPQKPSDYRYSERSGNNCYFPFSVNSGNVADIFGIPRDNNGDYDSDFNSFSRSGTSPELNKNSSSNSIVNSSSFTELGSLNPGSSPSASPSPDLSVKHEGNGFVM